jgi:hypothetical protein
VLIPEDQVEPVTVEWKGASYTYPSEMTPSLPAGTYLRRRIMKPLTKSARERILRETAAGTWISSPEAGRNGLWPHFKLSEAGDRLIGFRLGLMDKECAAKFEAQFC